MTIFPSWNKSLKSDPTVGKNHMTAKDKLWQTVLLCVHVCLCVCVPENTSNALHHGFFVRRSISSSGWLAVSPLRLTCHGISTVGTECIPLCLASIQGFRDLVPIPGLTQPAL